jgi:polyisoprenoid-binding protein YceI
MSKIVSLILILLLLLFGFGLGAENFKADTAHSSLSFTITHMVVSKVRGNFKDFKVDLKYDAKDIEKSSAEVVIKSASINTQNEKRDGHLRSADFFDVEKYPEITFKSTGVKKKGKKYALVGTLTMHGVSKEVTVPFEIMGQMTDPRGSIRLGIEGFTLLNRKDFALNWNRSLDKGGFVLGDQVTVEILLELKNVKK